MRSNSPASPGETGACSDGLPPAEDLDQVPASVAGQRIAHLVQAQAQLGQAPDTGQFDGVPQRVLAVAVRRARGLGQQADTVVSQPRSSWSAACSLC
jgi:hypothetical protein